MQHVSRILVVNQIFFIMKRNFLPPFVGISLTKSQFCFCTGLTMYKLRNLLNANETKYKKLGYSKYDKLLMPNVTLQLLADTGLQIDVDLFTQYVAGQRGFHSPTISAER